jgi:hypothetical protein
MSADLSTDELDLLLRAATGPTRDPDVALAGLLLGVRQRARRATPVPSARLAALLAAPSAAPLSPGSVPGPLIDRLPGPRRGMLARLAALAPTMKVLLAGSATAAAVTVSAVIADRPGPAPTPARVVTPARPPTHRPRSTSGPGARPVHPGVRPTTHSAVPPAGPPSEVHHPTTGPSQTDPSPSETEETEPPQPTETSGD